MKIKKYKENVFQLVFFSLPFLLYYDDMEQLFGSSSMLPSTGDVEDCNLEDETQTMSGIDWGEEIGIDDIPEY